MFPLSGQIFCNHHCRPVYCVLWTKAYLHRAHSVRLYELLHWGSISRAQTEVRQQIHAAFTALAHQISHWKVCLFMLLDLRHNITAPPLRGCVDHLTADAEFVEYKKTIGVSGGCPVSLLVNYQKRSEGCSHCLKISITFMWKNNLMV